MVCFANIVGRQAMANNQETIYRINHTSDLLTVIGWFAGLGWLWWSGSGRQSSALWWLFFAIAGMTANVLVLGSVVPFLLARVSRLITGRPDGLPKLFVTGMIICPLLAFATAMVVGRLLM